MLCASLALHGTPSLLPYENMACSASGNHPVLPPSLSVYDTCHTLHPSISNNIANQSRLHVSRISFFLSSPLHSSSHPNCVNAKPPFYFRPPNFILRCTKHVSHRVPTSLSCKQTSQLTPRTLPNPLPVSYLFCISISLCLVLAPTFFLYTEVSLCFSSSHHRHHQ